MKAELMMMPVTGVQYSIDSGSNLLSFLILRFLLGHNHISLLSSLEWSNAARRQIW